MTRDAMMKDKRCTEMLRMHPEMVPGDPSVD